jgi:hypothetical protein
MHRPDNVLVRIHQRGTEVECKAAMLARPDPKRSGRTSDIGCWMTLASSGPAVTKRMAAGPRSSSAGVAGARMAPKHHLPEATARPSTRSSARRAMTGILAAQSAEMRANGCGAMGSRSIRRRPSTRPSTAAKGSRGRTVTWSQV